MDLCLSLTTQLILDEIKKKDNHSKNVVIFPLSTNIMLASGYKGEMLEQFSSWLHIPQWLKIQIV